MPSVMRVWLDELERLPEYSTSLPTGACTGKTWKRKIGEEKWLIMQYGEIYGKDIGVYRFQVVLRQGPRRGDEHLPFKTSCTLEELR